MLEANELKVVRKIVGKTKINRIRSQQIRLYEDWGLSHGNYFFDKIDRSRRNMEIYKWKWIVFGALGCMNNTDFKKSKWQHCVLIVRNYDTYNYF